MILLLLACGANPRETVVCGNGGTDDADARMVVNDECGRLYVRIWQDEGGRAYYRCGMGDVHAADFCVDLDWFDEEE